MHAELRTIQTQILALYEQQRAKLASLPKADLEELLHLCDDSRLAETYSERVAGEINRTACCMILEGRKS